MKGRRARVIIPDELEVTSQEVKAFEEMAIQRMKAKGFRITMPRVQVIRVLAQSRQAMSAYAIHEQILATGGRIDVVSVYRILSTLLEAQLIHHVGIVDGYLACRLDREHCHVTVHIVCTRTNVVEELEIPDAAIKAIELQLREHGFAPENIKIEILGAFEESASALAGSRAGQ
jgi:Fe2+ or Zn2+ uptake regulation protein